ncbi:MAG: GH3 auxin-responsive promoter family protein [Saprospiraceae bacterium]
MMKKWINTAFRKYYEYRMRHVEEFIHRPHEVQRAVFDHLVATAANTEWGKKYDYATIKNPKIFAERVPVNDYESLKPCIERMMHGEANVLWRGKINRFSKSSGTTSDRSKYIPVSDENLHDCHIRGTWDTMTFFYNQRPDARQFEYKSLLMGGSLSQFSEHPDTTIGDVSAIMISEMPLVARPFFTPDFETALLPNFEEKIDRMARTIAKEKELVMIGGVPTWTVVLLRKVQEITGVTNFFELWPELQGYIHGGVSFTPYRQQFAELFPGEQVSYQEVYNASEGYFATQNDFSSDDMLLLLNNGVYYEFIPSEEWEKEFPKAIPLSEVEVGESYAMVISTSSGLWRYQPGDVVVFTQKYPYKIKITGRTKQFINVFGEEVMVENTDRALAQTCSEVDVRVADYSVAPIYFAGKEKGGHEWLIEFEKAPEVLEIFAKQLDKNLQKVNSDYEAKRYKSMALEELRLHVVPKNTFNNWLKSKGKYGGQHKVPRLANNRKYVDEILAFLND